MIGGAMVSSGGLWKETKPTISRAARSAAAGKDLSTKPLPRPCGFIRGIINDYVTETCPTTKGESVYLSSYEACLMGQLLVGRSRKVVPPMAPATNSAAGSSSSSRLLPVAPHTHPDTATKRPCVPSLDASTTSTSHRPAKCPRTDSTCDEI
jgi:hypothetical protein